MSRSYKKTPIFGNTTCRSEKPYKKLWHRRFRKHLKQGMEPHKHLIRDVWDMGKDGKQYWENATKRDMTK